MNILEVINKFAKTEEIEKNVYCPKCGKTMIKRKSKPGLKSEYWYGCSGYPGCRSIILDINLKEHHYKKYGLPKN